MLKARSNAKSSSHIYKSSLQSLICMRYRVLYNIPARMHGRGFPRSKRASIHLLPNLNHSFLRRVLPISCSKILADGRVCCSGLSPILKSFWVVGCGMHFCLSDTQSPTKLPSSPAAESFIVCSVLLSEPLAVPLPRTFFCPFQSPAIPLIA